MKTSKNILLTVLQKAFDIPINLPVCFRKECSILFNVLRYHFLSFIISGKNGHPIDGSNIPSWKMLNYP
jgi:hypothetical protein